MPEPNNPIRYKIKLSEGDIRPLAKWELLERIDQLTGRNMIRDKALASFLYLTGCRIQEVLGYYKETNWSRFITDKTTGEKIFTPIETREFKGRPILKKQVRVTDDTIIINTVRTLKRRKTVYRTIPILMTEHDQEFVDMFLIHYYSLNDEDPLFKIKRCRAYKIMREVGLFPHYFRHIRNTALATQYNFTASELRHWNGWSSSVSGDAYVHLAYKDLLRKMKKEEIDY